MRILTARPSLEDEARIPHKLYGILGVEENCSAGKWLKYAKMEIDWALAEGKTPIVVGGTGLYIKALTGGIPEMPLIDAGIRTQAISDFEEMGKLAFSERLQAIDPEFFVRLKVQDTQRLIRAYEVWLGSGKTLSWWQNREVIPPYNADALEIIKVELPREELYNRCNLRVEQMIEMGAMEEVANLLSLPTDLAIWKIIGMREFAAYLRGEMPLPKAIELCQIATRQYAKRQMTWFRNQV